MNILDFIHNITLLITLVVIYSFLLRFFSKRSIVLQLFSGILFGLIVIVGMMTAAEVKEGLFFDGRSVVLSVGAFFGGPLTAAISMMIAGTFRTVVGGEGMYAGLLSIFSASALGTAFFYLRSKVKIADGFLGYFTLGLLAHLTVLGWYYLLLGGISTSVFMSVFLPLLTLFPLATVLLCFLFKNLEQQNDLVNQSLLLRKVIDNIPATVYVKDRRLRKLLVNKKETELLGKEEKDLIGKTDFDLYPEEQAKRFEADDLQVIHYGKEIINREEHFVGQDGKSCWLLTSKSPFRDRFGNVVGLVGVGRDVTDLMETAHDLQQAKEEAENANKAKSEFLATMSHEIRTPMNAILGFSEILMQRINDPASKSMLQSVVSSGSLLLALLNDILDLSKIEAGKLIISPSSTDMISIIEEMKIFFKDRAEEKNVEIVLHKQRDFPERLLLDEVRVKQVLFNLVGNAVKFTPEGFVKIEMHFIKEAENKGVLKLQVSDTGIGIEPSQQEVIFLPFLQQNSKRNRTHEGTGLGLAISKRLVEKMGGSIRLKSIPGKGSTFTVHIPEVKIVDSADEQVIRKTISPEMITFEQSNVLVVDDAPSNLQLMEVMLTPLNLKIQTATGGQEALDLLEEYKPDLIILDILMPDIDGYETVKRIRDNKRLKNIPVLAFTAFIHREAHQEDDKLFDAFLHKPVDKEELIKMLKRFLKYFVKPETNDKLTQQAAGKDLEFDASVLPEEVKKQLPALTEILNTEFMEQWTQIKDHFVLFKIEDFAKRLQQTAESFHVDFLARYAGRLIDDIDTLDLESLKKQLHQFPDLVNRLKL